MSGRIRTVKPEWLEDEFLAAASDEARVLSIALILMADDHGRGRASIATIAAGAWRYQMEHDGGSHAPEILARASRALRELVAMGFVTLYEVARQRYFEIRNWAKHQKVDRPSKPRVPPPDDSSPRVIPPTLTDTRETLASVTREPRETLATDLRPHTTDHRPPTEEQHTSASPPSGPAKPDPSVPVRRVFDVWLEEHVAPEHRAKCKLNGKRRRLIEARLRERYTPEQLIDAIRGVKLSAFHMGENPDGKRYTGLETVLRDGAQVEKFGDLLANPPTPRLGGRRPTVAAPGTHDLFDRTYVPERADPELAWKETANA
jgi:hypothetical protein